MSIEVMLLGNSFFLAVVLIILLAIYYKNESLPENDSVKKDLEKIKEQIYN